ncbi:MAG: 4Fe-4S ferredoxin iron-sulfur binding domain protein [Clostridia bacterium 62_21]|nr:MAG: 4Fe-4S ferredoxin iron-sulfur binding domain protein [Clostridia bacterium 62_21]
MTGNIIRNLLSRPATRLYPAVKREPPPGSRGRILFFASRCAFCGECERVCPTQAVVLDTEWGGDEEGLQAVWDDDDVGGGATLVRFYDPNRCILCNLCIEACLYGALTCENRHITPSYTKTVEKGRVENW